jgi:hypothetical protein
MDHDQLEAYLAELARALRASGADEPAVLTELRGHLLDATEQAERRGLTHSAAQQEALARMGSVEVVAAAFSADRRRMMTRWLLCGAIVCGLLLSYVDSRPTWDDTGITAGVVLLLCGLLGLLAPRRPWMWALAVGSWIPLLEIVSTHTYTSLLALLIAFVGAYAGMGVRRLAQRA